MIANELGLALSGEEHAFSPNNIQEYLNKRTFDKHISFLNFKKNVHGKPIENNLITRSIIFRSHIDAKIFNFVLSLYEKYSNVGSNIQMDERFVMRSIVEKLIQIAYEKKITNSSDSICVPGDAFIFNLLKSTSNITEIESFVGSHGLDVSKIRRELKEQNSYNYRFGHGDFILDHNEGSFFVPYNIAKLELESLGNVQFESSLLHITENGSSAFKFRTGLEIKRSTLNKSKSFIIAFSDYLSYIGKNAYVTIRGGRERGHAYDNYFEKQSGKPIRSKINAAEKNSKGRTTKHEILNDSHIFGNCLDLRASGVDGLLLYAFIDNHCYTKQGNKTKIEMNKRMRFKKGPLEFDFMFHGGEPMGGHFHCYFS